MLLFENIIDAIKSSADILNSFSADSVKSCAANKMGTIINTLAYENVIFTQYVFYSVILLVKMVSANAFY